MRVACTLRSFITVVVVSLLAACGGGSGGSAEAKRTAEDDVSFLLLEFQCGFHSKNLTKGLQEKVCIK